ncbi:MAG: pilin [Candidatus Roizmanbacteria bacterium]|nr:pilin [Candidatus Roizmanbacteria bacterium]
MNIIPQVYAEVNFGDKTVNPIAKFDSITTLVNLILPIMMLVGGFITLGMLLLGAYRYLTSEGNPEKVSKAQSVIMYAIIGLFLIVASFVLTRIIGYVLKVNMPL